MHQVTKVKRCGEFTQRDSDNNMISNNPLSIVTLHLDDSPSILIVHPVDAANRPIVAHQVRGQL